MEPVNNTHFGPLWPLAWWENPYYIGLLIASVLGMCILWVIWNWWRRRTRVPRRMVDRLLYQIRLTERLDDGVEANRTYIAMLLLQMMREYAYHYFGLVHNALTDAEFVTAVRARGLPDQFVELVERLYSDTVALKFAHGDVSVDHIRSQRAAVCEFLKAIPPH